MSQQIPRTVAHGGGIGALSVEANASQAVTHAQTSALPQKVTDAGYGIGKTETLRTFDGQQGFTITQGR